ncbi:MAG: transposase [Elusimicrobiota bacterium]
MARKKFKPEQIVAILREADTSGSIKDACRKHGITETTFYRWNLEVDVDYGAGDAVSAADN